MKFIALRSFAGNFKDLGKNASISKGQKIELKDNDNINDLIKARYIEPIDDDTD